MASVSLLDLPIELREAVYTYVFEDAILSLCTQTSVWHTAEAHDTNCTKRRGLHVAWVSACKQIYHHALALFWLCFKLEIEVERLFSDRHHGLWNTDPLAKLSVMTKSVQNVVLVDSVETGKGKRLAAFTSFALDWRRLECMRTLTVRWKPSWKWFPHEMECPWDREIDAPAALKFLFCFDFDIGDAVILGRDEQNHNNKRQICRRRVAFNEFLSLLRYHLQPNEAQPVLPLVLSDTDKDQVLIKVELEYTVKRWPSSSGTPSVIAKLTSNMDINYRTSHPKLSIQDFGNDEEGHLFLWSREREWRDMLKKEGYR